MSTKRAVKTIIRVVSAAVKGHFSPSPIPKKNGGRGKIHMKPACADDK